MVPRIIAPKMIIIMNEHVLTFFEKFIPPQANFEEKRRLVLFISLSLVGVFALFIFGIIAIFQNNTLLATTDLLTSFILSLNLWHYSIKKKLRFNIFIALSIISFVFVQLYVTGGTEQSAFVWYFTYPLIACFLLGSFPGIIATMIMIIPVIMMVFWSSEFSFTANYNLNLELRFIASYLVVGTFAYVFERNGEHNRKVLHDINQSLEKIILERTSELISKNKQLEEEIKERIKAEKEVHLSHEQREKIEDQLHRAQKMEAIGTLAGGVAHDLNNVLSGIVSYPEMLLWNLEKNSPLHKPLLTIQKAGQKAAAIVQDLLTLTRRGVNVIEVVDLNEIITDYLQSPEYDKLMSYHPNISIIKNMDQKLLHLKGSPIHIRKTIMNLISNAAEAQQDYGEISISTYNHTFDSSKTSTKPDRIGTFSALEITDKGCGMTEEDMERIFEPFYTKKIMGRSGSGLGMAVVWGTVQDHHGFIDIESRPNRGTTFTLYFPSTQEQLKKEQVSIPITQYMGNQETILVVDDNEEQREIASNILTSLNYKASTACSGEEAINCIKNNNNDMLLLDMIMDPGIDGLETYKKIIEINPDQKAVIASGFAETDRVKEVQQLGASSFIKKPYSMETIGMALKKELTKQP